MNNKIKYLTSDEAQIEFDKYGETCGHFTIQNISGQNNFPPIFHIDGEDNKERHAVIGKNRPNGFNKITIKVIGDPRISISFCLRYRVNGRELLTPTQMNCIPQNDRFTESTLAITDQSIEGFFINCPDLTQDEKDKKDIDIYYQFTK